MASETVNPNTTADESGNNANSNMNPPDPRPSAGILQQAGELQVLDEHGEKIAFKSLYTPTDTVKRYLIIFIRHFSCGSCESYVRTLSAHPHLTSTPDLQPLLIGCGQPTIIPSYRARTQTPFPIYCDPSRALYAQLNMTSTLDAGAHKPKYITDSTLATTLTSLPNVLKSGFNFSTKGFNGGNFSQNGGEWLFVEGQLQWCHLMKHTRDHAEVDELETILGLPHESGPAAAIRYNIEQTRLASERAGRRPISGADPLVKAVSGAYSRTGAALPPRQRRPRQGQYIRLPDSDSPSPSPLPSHSPSPSHSNSQASNNDPAATVAAARSRTCWKFPFFPCFSKTWRAERREKELREEREARARQHGPVELTEMGVRDWGVRAGRLDAGEVPAAAVGSGVAD
ncbi:hypothetical protein B0A55_01004 [Friedmanniomyces simplex]|uniref:Thioredoxin-like fold domain-containing protein n=1 Tax=Friedmanniomyces simplex TaxID=329884 RepID=A0A4U0Y1U5_9PEZI|nr:hypothetical protein B0A55_01004 [Friedmanniomyces simplex]